MQDDGDVYSMATPQSPIIVKYIHGREDVMDILSVDITFIDIVNIGRLRFKSLNNSIFTYKYCIPPENEHMMFSLQRLNSKYIEIKITDLNEQISDSTNRLFVARRMKTQDWMCRWKAT